MQTDPLPAGVPLEDEPDYRAEYRPELLSRRGEFVAWGGAILVGASWALLFFLGQDVHRAVPILAVVLLLVAFSISLGNWMDRRTVLHLRPEGVTFHNGLRRTDLTWREIREVQVFPSPWGKKVRVIGPQSQFQFRTLGEVKVQGETKGRMGFVAGDKILHTILQSTRLRSVSRSTAGEYYARE